MIVTSAGQHGHSADVEMQLFINGTSWSIGQMGPDFLLLDDGAAHPPAEATIMLRVDAHEERWPVYLPDGIAAGACRVRIALPA